MGIRNMQLNYCTSKVHHQATKTKQLSGKIGYIRYMLY